MPAQTTKSARIEARLTPAALESVRRAAEIEGRSLSEFVVAAAEQAARKTLESTLLVGLSASDQRRFVEALLQPAPPNAAMRRAHEHRRRLVGDP